MRISDLTIRQFFSRDLQARIASVAGAQRRVASGLKVETAADAPNDAARIVRLDGQLSDIAAYRRAGTNATTRLAIEESVIKAARDLVQEAKSLALSVANTDPGDANRLAVEEQLQRIQEQLVALGNTKLGDEYIFAGGRTDQPAFLADGTYMGDTTERRAQVDAGLTITTTHTGGDLFDSSMQAIRTATLTVSGGSSAQIQSSISGLQVASQELLTREAETGARQNSVDRSLKTLAARNAQMLDVRDGLVAADPATSTVELIGAQNALERAYAAVAKVLNTSLLDFLR